MVVVNIRKPSFSIATFLIILLFHRSHLSSKALLVRCSTLVFVGIVTESEVIHEFLVLSHAIVVAM